MKYIITGSVGNISKPIVKQLISEGHTAIVISSNPGKKTEIEQSGATAAIGSVTNKNFLKNTFEGADAVYLMIPPNWVVTDFPAYQKEVADNYIYAVKEAAIKYVVLLSSMGAHLKKGAGPIDGLAYLEEELGTLKSVNVKILRPGYFYYNLHSQGNLVKQAGIMGANFGSTTEKMLLVHPDDIAAEALKHLLRLDFKGHSIEYIVSDEKTAFEVAEVLGRSIDKPNTPWVVFKDEESTDGLLKAGITPTMAEGFTQMGKAFREGLVQEDYFKLHGKPVGKIKLEDFAKEFASVYNQSN